MAFTWYILSPPLGHTRLQPLAGHMLTPSLSPVYEVAERDNRNTGVITESKNIKKHKRLQTELNLATTL